MTPTKDDDDDDIELWVEPEPPLTPWHLILVIIIALVLLMAGAYMQANAHEWYTGKKDPLTNNSCCGGSDCAAIPTQWITDVPGGVRVQMTLEQAQQVNPNAVFPVDAFVAEERIQRSPDLEWHACVYQSNRGAPGYGIICLWGFRGT